MVWLPLTAAEGVCLEVPEQAVLRISQTCVGELDCGQAKRPKRASVLRKGRREKSARQSQVSGLDRAFM